MTTDPVLHALVDLCEAISKLPSTEQSGPAYHRAMNVIREHTGLAPRPPEAAAFQAECWQHAIETHMIRDGLDGVRLIEAEVSEKRSAPQLERP